MTKDLSTVQEKNNISVFYKGHFFTLCIVQLKLLEHLSRCHPFIKIEISSDDFKDKKKLQCLTIAIVFELIYS